MQLDIFLKKSGEYDVELDCGETGQSSKAEKVGGKHYKVLFDCLPKSIIVKKEGNDNDKTDEV